MANTIVFKEGSGAPDDAGDGVRSEPLYDYTNHKLYISDDNAATPKEVGSETYLPLSGGALTGNLTTNALIDTRDVAADGVLATNAMPKGGGAFTGAVTTNSTFDGVDIATRDAILTSTTTTAGNALPKAGGTMTGNIALDGEYLSGDGGDEGLRIEADGVGNFSHGLGVGAIPYGATQFVVSLEHEYPVHVGQPDEGDCGISINGREAAGAYQHLAFNNDGGPTGGSGESGAHMTSDIRSTVINTDNSETLKGKLEFRTNAGDSILTGLTINEVQTSTFASHLVTGADKGLYFNSTFHTGYAGNDSTNTLTMATNNVARLVINDTSTTVEGKTYIQDGALGAPGIAFESDTDTGIYRSGGDTMALVTGGASAIAISAGQALLISGEVIFQDAITSATSAVFSGTVQCATPTADTHAATRLYVDYTKYIRHYMNCGWNQPNTTLSYLPLNGYIYERTSLSGYNESVAFCAPHDGLVEKVIIRSEEACGSRCTVGFHKSDEGTEVPNTTATETIEVDMPSDDTGYTFAFTGTSSFDKGDILAFSFNPASNPNDTVATIVLKFDTTT